MALSGVLGFFSPVVKLLSPVVNPWNTFDTFPHRTPTERRDYMIKRLENARRHEYVWITVVAGIGFFSDAYSIFSINVVVPLLSIVYWDELGGGDNYQVALSTVTLAGVLLGQIGFGIAADFWGRRKIYGLELIIVVFTTLGIAFSSTGEYSSMNILSLLLFWRFFLGLGLGGDYPLSAVICSEFAPTRLRGAMMTAVVTGQSLGQVAAALVALIAVAGFHNSLPSEPGNCNCDQDCLKNIDSMWRLIVGLGAIPGFVALWFRLTLIESPRYTADVARNSFQAAADVTHFYELEQPVSSSASSLNGGQDHEAPAALGNPANPVPAFQAFDFDDGHPSLPSWKDFKQFICRPRVQKALIAASFCWFCVDLPFYGLGLNTASNINVIWSGGDPTVCTKIFGVNILAPSYLQPFPGILRYLYQISYQSLVVVSIGAIVGNLIALITIDRLGRRVIQMIGFFWLFILYLIIGVSFKFIASNQPPNQPGALIVLYLLTQVFFYFGPNTTTYIIPAEIFPTRYRCTCHGISAAIGKLGSIIALCFVFFVKYSGVPDNLSLGYKLLCLSAFMLIGLVITYYLIPDVRDENGKVKSLEKLAEEMELS